MKSLLNRKNKYSVKTIVLIILSTLQICFIFSNSLFDRSQSLKQSGFAQHILQKVSNVATSPFGMSFEITQHFVRKLAHFTEFFVLGILVFVLLVVIFSNKSNINIQRRTILAMVAAIFICALIGTCDELLQFVSGRAPMLQDVILDSIGGACGVLIAQLIRRAVGKWTI